MSTTNSKLQNAVRVALGLSVGALAVSVSTVAMAQDAGDEAVEEITVTGSRIKRKDFTSNAPVYTLEGNQVALTGTVNIESLLNTLPQTVPGLDRTSNNPGAGIATIDLRGLGSNRTLVLMDGTRVIPNTSGGTVDINTIPTALIKNVEVLTGGASAVYGSDAIAGVVNFIMKDDFEGAQYNLGYEVSENNDAEIWSSDITLGANLFDGKGNVVVNFSYTQRDALFQGSRRFSKFDLGDTSDHSALEPGGSSGVPGTSIFSAALSDFAPTSLALIFNQDGSARPFVRSGANQDFYNFAPVNFLQLPEKRYQISALGHFDASDHATFYGSALFSSSQVPQELAPTPIFQTSTITLDSNPFLTPATQQILSDAFGDGVDTDGDGIDDEATAFFRRRLVEVGPRNVDNANEAFQIKAGLRGDITDNWGYDVYAQFGNTTGTEVQSGNVNRDRFKQALLLDLSDPTGGTCADSSTNGATIACAPINIFGEGNISEAGAAFLRTAAVSRTDLDQWIVSGTINGSLGEKLALPGGEIGIAFGYERIENGFKFRPSQDIAAGTIAGFNGAPPVNGGYDVDSFYAELYLPILSGVRFADQLDLELAYRNSDYTTVGSVDTYKIAGSWAPVGEFRIRAGFNRAVRAPSIGELFAPQGENFPSSEDPCSALGDPNPSAGLIAICEANGVPAGLTGSPALDLAAGQVRELSGGNPNLSEEEADTYTVGVVWTPTFIDGLSLSVDYFDIEIDDFVADFGGGANNVLSICFDPNDPAGGIGSPFCDVVNRRPDGTIEFVSVSSANVATQTHTGFDIVGSYNRELFGGDLRLNYAGTVTTENEFEAFKGATKIVCDGNFGNDCGEPLPEYTHRLTADWSRDNYTAQVTWRYIGEVTDDNKDTIFFKNTLGSTSYYDLSGVYSFTDNYRLTFGVRNLLDNAPPIIGNNDEQANTFPATYDVFGRTFFLKGTVQF